MPANGNNSRVLVMGVGNTLLQDDGVGIHITEKLRTESAEYPEVDFVDGGTIGLSLLPQIEDADAVIIVDAAEIGERPGTVRVFRNREIDQQLSGKKRTVHEVAVADLMAAAELRGRSPTERALVAIQPSSIEWGLELTPDVQAAVPLACDAIRQLTQRWRDEA
jgi:hydrogenase maturation protease